MGLPDKEFYSIKEVAEETQIKPFVLRFWETEFKNLRPARRNSGHRKYTKPDIEFIKQIKELLYLKKFSIAGAKQHLLELKKLQQKQLKFELEESSHAIELLKSLKKELLEIEKMLK